MALADTAYLESLVGRESLAILVSRCGGLDVYIPTRTPLGGKLGDLPLPAQEALVRTFGGTKLYVPKCDGSARCARNAVIRSEYEAGASVPNLARKYQLTERQVRKILGRPEKKRDAFF